MTPRSDPEEDMSMEEILASIRKFVSENPQEEAYQQRNHKGETVDSVASTPMGHSRRQDNRVNYTQPSPLNFAPTTSEHPSVVPTAPHFHPSTTHEHLKRSVYEPDILELTSPLPQTQDPKNSPSQVRSVREHLAPWTPPSRTSAQQKIIEDSIITLTNPIESQSSLKEGKSARSQVKLSTFGESGESLVSSQTIAASASSLTRLAQASKTAPKRSSTLADHREVTLDQIIQDLIRPMIKQWIDTHLSSLVEEMVAKEIKRITKHLG